MSNEEAMDKFRKFAMTKESMEKSKILDEKYPDLTNNDLNDIRNRLAAGKEIYYDKYEKRSKRYE